MISLTTLSALVTLAVWVPAHGSSAGIVAFTALFGFASGGFVSLFPTLVAQVSDIRQIGIRTGSGLAVMSFGALTGSPLAGAIVQSQGGGYVGLQLFCGLCMVGGVALMVVARGVVGGWGKVVVRV